MMPTVFAIFSRWLPLLMLMTGLSGPVSAHTEAGEEDAIKTAYLFNFFKFIDWPVDVSRATFSLCTTHNDQLGDSLAVLENKTIYGKLMVVRRDLNAEELKDCHLVYIGIADNAAAILDRLKGLPIVTVSDQANFIAQGGMIGLVHDGDRLSFEINLDVAKAQGVHISAKLLKLAKSVIINQ